jgi:hypothetical protein
MQSLLAACRIKWDGFRHNASPPGHLFPAVVDNKTKQVQRASKQASVVPVCACPVLSCHFSPPNISYYYLDCPDRTLLQRPIRLSAHKPTCCAVCACLHLPLPAVCVALPNPHPNLPVSPPPNLHLHSLTSSPPLSLFLSSSHLSPIVVSRILSSLRLPICWSLAPRIARWIDSKITFVSLRHRPGLSSSRVLLPKISR